jgi:hypothetical protein
LLVALFATTYLYTRAVVRVPVRHTVSELVQWRMLVPVLAAASVHGFALVAALRGARVGMFGRVLSEGELGTTRTGGVFFASVIANLVHAMNGLASPSLPHALSPTLSIRGCVRQVPPWR